MFVKMFQGLLVGATFGLAACQGSDASVSATDVSADAVTTEGTSTSLAAGQKVHVIFSVTQPDQVALVAVCEGERGCPGLGAMGPRPMGQPFGEPPSGQPPYGPRQQGVPPVDDGIVRGALAGPLEAVDSATGSLRLVGAQVLTDVDTSFVGVATLAELAVGMDVAARGEVNADGLLLAKEVRALAPRLAGVITAVSTDAGTTITVLGRVITLSADTKILVITPPVMGQGGGQMGGGRMGGGHMGGGQMGGSGPMSGTHG